MHTMLAGEVCTFLVISGALEKSILLKRVFRGPIAGTNFVDWPITYAELEPYYTKVDWEIGLSGIARPLGSRRVLATTPVLRCQ